tara:strand:+ start:4185 stop:4664 length:480 start_codon:yes stop_codon:yes gene_type:complete
MNNLLNFPNPVNEYAARTVAFMVLILSILTLIFNSPSLSAILLYGFLARVLTGPKLSPMGIIATKLIVPKFIKKEKLVPGPPKRFAQLIGLIFSIVIFISITITQTNFLSNTLLIILSMFAFLESILGFCAGCYVFQYLIKFKLIPNSICESCNNIQTN